MVLYGSVELLGESYPDLAQRGRADAQVVGAIERLGRTADVERLRVVEQAPGEQFDGILLRAQPELRVRDCLRADPGDVRPRVVLLAGVDRVGADEAGPAAGQRAGVGAGERASEKTFALDPAGRVPSEFDA